MSFKLTPFQGSTKNKISNRGTRNKQSKPQDTGRDI